MRGHILVATALITAGWLAACSKPAPQTGKSLDPTPEASRRLLLVTSPSSDAAVVSDLEAGHSHHAAPASSPAPKRLLRSAVAAVMTPMPRLMGSSLAEPSLELAPVPVAPVPVAAVASEAVVAEDPQPSGGYHGHHPVTESPTHFLGGGVNRGPVVIIRGGMGGPDDDCDLRHGHRPGMAVNRMAPPFGGYGGGMGGRGGIR